MSIYDMVTKLLVAKDRLLYRLDDHTFCFGRLLANLWAGLSWREALERTDAEWTEFAQERRSRALADAHRLDREWARQIEEEWIPKHVQQIASGSAEDVERLVRHCQIIKMMDLSVHDRAFQLAVDRWVESIERAVAQRR
ncbi:MAG: hypothetical protein ABFE07_28075 [Armatimonadia bacterium]